MKNKLTLIHKEMKTSIRLTQTKVFLTILFSAACMIASAQVKFKAGPVIGAGYKTITGLSKMGSGNYYSFGVTSQIQLNSKFSLTPEILYSSKGLRFYSYQSDLFFGSKKSDEKITLKYMNLSVPVMYKIKGVFGITAGFELGYLIAADYELEGQTSAGLFYDGNIYASNFWDDVTDEFRRFDAGIIIGPSFYFRNGIMLGALTDIGVVDINENSKMKNNLNFSLKFAYLFSSGNNAGN